MLALGIRRGQPSSRVPVQVIYDFLIPDDLQKLKLRFEDGYAHILEDYEFPVSGETLKTGERLNLKDVYQGESPLNINLRTEAAFRAFLEKPHFQPISLTLESDWEYNPQGWWETLPQEPPKPKLAERLMKSNWTYLVMTPVLLAQLFYFRQYLVETLNQN